jgi:hypothetical protein
MPQYTCRNCNQSTFFQTAIARGATQNCPNCVGGTISHKDINHGYNPYAGLSFVAPKRQKTGALVAAPVQGRSPGAPVRTDWPGANLNAQVTHVQSLQSNAWINAGADKICLAYNCLDPLRPGKEGILIHCAAKVGRANVIAHFAAVRMKLESPPNPTAVTEATGEAAGFDMHWGMHVHAGAGIDQIWKRTTITGRRQYFIVEAKGPGQLLNLNQWMPPHFEQMNTRWIMHNLQTMRLNSHQIAIDIIADLKLTMGTRWPGYQGASKNYYGVTGTTGAPVADLYGVVITALWQPDGMLHYACTNFRQYTNFTM